MSSAGIYRCCEIRDELLIALITNGFDSLGAAVRRAPDVDSRDSNHLLVELLVAYRAWAFGSRHLFARLFTDSVHGFVSLEPFHHLDWSDADLDAEFVRLLAQLVDSL